MRKRRYKILLGFMASEEMCRQVQEICDKEEISVSEFLRGAVQMALGKKHRTRSPEVLIIDGEGFE